MQQPNKLLAYDLPILPIVLILLRLHMAQLVSQPITFDSFYGN